MAKVGNYSINPKLKNVSLDQFTKLVGDAFKLVPEKDREKEIKKAYEKQYGKVKESNSKSKEDQSSGNSRKERTKE